MPHPLVDQLRFARSEFVRCLEGVTDEDARKRLMPMNCISWMIGHLANQEQHYWLRVPSGRVPVRGLGELVGFGKPASTPPLDEMWEAWRTITTEADQYLDTLTEEMLVTHNVWRDKPVYESNGTMLYRNTYHYWYHTGEASAVRQMLGHENVPDFVGNMSRAVFRPG